MPTIKPTNVTAQLLHVARGNPPSVSASSAISNCFPGLEFDFRNTWKNLFEGIELHEAGLGEFGHRVVDVTPGSAAAQAGVTLFARLVAVNGRSVDGFRTDPQGPTNRTTSMELCNALADLFLLQGTTVDCTFSRLDNTSLTVALLVRPVLDKGAIAEALAEPGALTQSLCSPWQADYRECGCYYWAASRPDFVNATGQNDGHDWMQRDKSAGQPYRPDPGGRTPATHITYDNLYQAWETHLRFVIGGKDTE